MSTARVAVYEPRVTVLSQGLCVSIAEVDGFALCLRTHDGGVLERQVRSQDITIVFMVLAAALHPDALLISRLKLSGTRRAVVLVTPSASQEAVVGSIRAGASGLMTADTPIEEMQEALLTLRNGHDYFSKSIAGLLVSRYVEGLRGHDREVEARTALLSKREREVLSLWGEGKTNPEIAAALFLSVRTVESHRNHIMQKLQLRTTVDLVRFAIRNNIIDP